ncbi:ATP-grasp domain-containing protein [Streptomyces sp. DSM 41972]|uniref:ATP-grasp domain-containing protein n=1 Tax=Streptomyces althioticus subsp. attaecolombicae TaxID=3075534 RepID=A0ABU3I049_9ACTN|nr:ATP-grasp domain-containing protein [Streptomyces sp. DSM 41972]SCD88843.1 ATP-grasp domain-containing protein [Streptomyces sp. di50b]SCE41390.1 ATP-grasp domain-containing protein [Streptomyces sp. di188]
MNADVHGDRGQGPCVVVDPYSSGALFAEALRSQGVPVAAVVSSPSPPEAYASSYRSQDFPDVIVYDGDLDDVVRRVRALDPRCVIAGCESGVELAERLAPRVLPERSNVPELAEARRDKSRMATAVRAAGLPVIPQICTADVEEAAAWLGSEGLVGADLVIKPPKSASTDGVIKVQGGTDWRAVFERQIGRINQFGEVDDRLVVQKFVTGTEYVVDTFSHDGKHSLVDVCSYGKVYNGPHMAVYDTMRWLPPDEPVVAPLAEYVFDVLDAVGVRFGSAHVEVMGTADGPVLIELGARPHGGGQPRFNRNATGDSQIDRTVRWLTGGELPQGYELLTHQMCVFHMARRSGTVRDTAVLDEIRTLPSHHFSVQNLSDGDHVSVTKDLVDSLDFGFVILAHPDEEQLERDYRIIRALEQKLVIEQP